METQRVMGGALWAHVDDFRAHIDNFRAQVDDFRAQVDDFRAHIDGFGPYRRLWPTWMTLGHAAHVDDEDKEEGGRYSCGSRDGYIGGREKMTSVQVGRYEDKKSLEQTKAASGSQRDGKVRTKLPVLLPHRVPAGSAAAALIQMRGTTRTAPCTIWLI
ncbi:hypothetical protein EYF80_049774 [Liparis tanakae]|uniref:Uncharacterized protein n=1 Tax=Liparis tanakae TaxID=230148 RepID=A0A4Z2FGL7_9TELE|nr:hypothetical protein EYF80_049774 [Liparis tanakae]